MFVYLGFSEERFRTLKRKLLSEKDKSSEVKFEARSVGENLDSTAGIVFLMLYSKYKTYTCRWDIADLS